MKRTFKFKTSHRNPLKKSNKTQPLKDRERVSPPKKKGKK